jgi:multidrug efflux pump subunit AcrB
MTALGAIIALLPLAIGIGTGSELHQPLAIAVIGVLIAMPLLLIVLPSCIILISNKRVLSNRRFHLFIVFEMEK